MSFPARWVRCTKCGFREEITTAQRPDTPVVNDRCSNCGENAVNEE